MIYSQTQLYLIGVGAIIGWGAFVLPGDLFIKDAGPFLTTLALFFSVFLMSIIGMAYRVVMINDINEKSPLAIVNNLFGCHHGFIYGWSLCIGYISIIGLNVTTLALLIRFFFDVEFSGKYLYTIFSWDVYAYEVAFCTIVLFLCVFANFNKSIITFDFQKVVTVTLCISVIILSISLFISEAASVDHLLPLISDKSDSLVGIFSILAIAPWAFIGFEMIPQLSRNSNLSGNKVYRVMLLSLLSGAAIYSVISISSSLTYPWEEVSKDEHGWLVGDVVRSSLGLPGMLVLGTAMVSSILAGISGFITGASRLVSNMSEQLLLPAFINKSYKGKYNLGLCFIAFIASFSPFFGRNSLLLLVEVSSIGLSIAFIYISLASAVLSKAKENSLSLLLSFLSLFISIGFILILIVPSSPSWIGMETIYVFLTCVGFGALIRIYSYGFYKR